MNAMLQRKAPPSVHRVLATPGRPLDAATPASPPSRFAHDFTRVPATLPVGTPGDAFERDADHSATRPADLSVVRVHTDAGAAQSARELHARAYTVGSHIVFDAGEYAPHTVAGQHLLAHELAHVAQQNEGRVAPMVQRKLRVDKPKRHGAAVEGYADRLCEGGEWTVDRETGELSSPKRDEVCGQVGSKTPTSCGCLCDVTGKNGPSVVFHIGRIVKTEGGDELDPVHTGQGQTVHSNEHRPDTHTAQTGRGTTVGGVRSGVKKSAGRLSKLSEPAWLIFAHEICGHALKVHQLRAAGAPLPVGHVQTREGTSAVDIENLIRREHSTPQKDLGQRAGEVPVPGADIGGGTYQVAEGETPKSIARRCGIPENRISKFLFKNVSISEGQDPTVTATTAIAGETLFIRGIAYHQIFPGDTWDSIAELWGVDKMQLVFANAGIALRPGLRLLIPVRKGAR